MENVLVNWIQEERKAGQAIITCQTKSQAEIILRTKHSDKNKKFLCRHNIVNKSITSIDQK